MDYYNHVIINYSDIIYPARPHLEYTDNIIIAIGQRN